MEGFQRFRFSVLAVPLQKGAFCVSVQFNREGRFRFRFRFLENGSGGSGSTFGLPSCQLALCFRSFPCKSVVLNLASRLGVSWICSLNCKFLLFLVSHARPSRLFGGPAALLQARVTQALPAAFSGRRHCHRQHVLLFADKGRAPFKFL